MGSLLKLEGIIAGYKDITVLPGFSIEIEPGEKVLLIGPNGAGKSTFFKVTAGLLFPIEGKVYFNGKDITHWSTEKRVATGMGYLLQTDNIVPSLTGIENLQLSAAFLKKRDFNSRMEKIISVIPFIESLLEKKAGLLSGGERQLLAISMVLIRQPKLLLLDEPTAGLSPKAAREVMNYLQKLQEVLGIDTVCMVEHNLKEAMRWANRVIVMAGGKVVYETKEVQKFLEDFKKLEKYFFGIN